MGSLWIALAFAVGDRVLCLIAPPACPPYVNFYCACDINELSKLIPVKMCLYQQYGGSACHPCPNHLQDYVGCNSCPKNDCPICSSEVFGLSALNNVGQNSVENRNSIFFKFAKDRNGLYYLPQRPVYNYNLSSNENELTSLNSSDRLKQNLVFKNESFISKKDENVTPTSSTVEKKEAFAKIKIIYDEPNFNDDNSRGEKFIAFDLPAANLQASNFPAFKSRPANLQASNFPAFRSRAANLQGVNFPSGNYQPANLRGTNYYAAKFPNAYSYQKPYLRYRRDISQKVVADDRNKDEKLERKREFEKNGSSQKHKKRYDRDSRVNSVKSDSKLGYNINDDKYGGENHGRGQIENIAQSDLPMKLLVLETEDKKLVGLNEENYETGADQGYSKKSNNSGSRGKIFGNQEEWNFKTSNFSTNAGKTHMLDDHSLSFKTLEMLPFKNYSSAEQIHLDKKRRINTLISNKYSVNNVFYQNYEMSSNLKPHKETKRLGGSNKIANHKNKVNSEDGSISEYLLRNDLMKLNPNFRNRALTYENLLSFGLLSNGIVRNKCAVSNIKIISSIYSGNANVIPVYEFACTIFKNSNELKDVKSSNSLLTSENESSENEHFFSQEELIPLVEDILRCLLDQEKERFIVIPNETKVDLSNCQFTILPNFIVKLIKNNSEINFAKAGIMKESIKERFKIIQTLFSHVQLEITNIINYRISPSSSLATIKDVENPFIIVSGLFNFKVNLLLQSNQSNMVHSDQLRREMNTDIDPTHMPIQSKSFDKDLLFSDTKSNLRFYIFMFHLPLLNSSDPKQKKSTNYKIDNVVPNLYHRTGQRNSNFPNGNQLFNSFTFRKQLNTNAQFQDLPRVSYYRRIFFDLNKNPKSNSNPFRIQSHKMSGRNETELFMSGDKLLKQNQISNSNPKFKTFNTLESEPATNWFNLFNLPTIENILSTMSILFSSLPILNSSSQADTMKKNSKISAQIFNSSDLFRMKPTEQHYSYFNSNVYNNKTAKGHDNYGLLHVGIEPDKTDDTFHGIFKMKLNKSAQNSSFDVKGSESLDHSDTDDFLMMGGSNENVIKQLKQNMKDINDNFIISDSTNNSSKTNLTTENVSNQMVNVSSLSIGDAENHSDVKHGVSNHRYNKSNLQTTPQLNLKFTKNEKNKKSDFESIAENENKLSAMKLEENYRSSSDDLLSSPENHIMNGQNTSENEIPHGTQYRKRRLLQLYNQNEIDSEYIIEEVIDENSNSSRSKRSYNMPHNNWCTISRMTRHGILECTVWSHRKECILMCHPGYSINNQASGKFQCMRKGNQWKPKMEACVGNGKGSNGIPPGLDEYFPEDYEPVAPGKGKYFSDIQGPDGGAGEGEYYDESAADSFADNYEDNLVGKKSVTYADPIHPDAYQDDEQYYGDAENEDYRMK